MACSWQVKLTCHVHIKVEGANIFWRTSGFRLAFLLDHFSVQWLWKINSLGDYQQQPTLQIFFQFWVAKTIRKKTEKNLQLQLVEGCPSTLRPKNPCQWAPPVALNQEGDPVHFWVADMETLKFEDVLILVTIPMILPMKTHESRTCPCFFFLTAIHGLLLRQKIPPTKNPIIYNISPMDPHWPGQRNHGETPNGFKGVPSVKITCSYWRLKSW